MPLVQRVCKACNVSRSLKRHNTKKYGKLPVKDPELIPWHTLCIDLSGPYTFGKKTEKVDDMVTLHCLTIRNNQEDYYHMESPSKFHHQTYPPSRW